MTNHSKDTGLGEGLKGAEHAPCVCEQDVYVIPDEQNELVSALETEPAADDLKHVTVMKLNLSLHGKSPSKPSHCPCAQVSAWELLQALATADTDTEDDADQGETCVKEEMMDDDNEPKPKKARVTRELTRQDSVLKCG